MTLLASQMKNIAQQKKLVYGLGMTGYSCVSYLVKLGYDVVAFDTRDNPPYLKKVYCEFPQVEVYLTEIDMDVLQTVKQIIASPGVSLSSPILKKAKQAGIDIIGDVQLFALQAQRPIIAITGSNGKTTTTSLVSEMFKKSGKSVKIGGNIGVPVLELLGQEIPDFYVLELSSFQLETTPDLRAAVAVVLNISEDHMDRYASIDQYAESKLSIYSQAKTKLINLDDEWTSQHVDKKNTIAFSSGTPAKGEYGLTFIDGEQWISFGEELICNTSNFKMKGRHQLANAIAAIAIGDLCHLSRDAMSQVLGEFEGLPHRTQFIAQINGVTYINDSKGTNIGATQAAIKGLDAPIILIAGGESKGADFTGFAKSLLGNVKQVILIGRDAGRIENKIRDSIPVIRAVNLPAAVQLAAGIAETGDCVLLSPACASFDMFNNYQHRGEVFIDAVSALK